MNTETEQEAKWNGLETLEPTGPTTSLPEAETGGDAAGSLTSAEAQGCVCRTVTLGETGTFLELCMRAQSRRGLKRLSPQHFFPVFTLWQILPKPQGRAYEQRRADQTNYFNPEAGKFVQVQLLCCRSSYDQQRELVWGQKVEGGVEGKGAGPDNRSRCTGSLSHSLMNLT